MTLDHMSPKDFKGFKEAQDKMGDGVQGVKAILYISPQALGIHKDKETTDTKVTIQNTPLKTKHLRPGPKTKLKHWLDQTS